MDLSRYAARLVSPTVPTAHSKPSHRTKIEVPGITSLIRDFQPARKQASQDSIEMPQEPEDAHLTGGTRSLARRLLALNMPVVDQRPVRKPVTRVRKIALSPAAAL